jgi:hypothetical protein
MKIALDYDGTYTLDPEFWDLVIALAHSHKHDIRIVTMRKPEMKIEINWPPHTLDVIYTSNKQKREYCDEIGWHPAIWIDDSPEFIVRSGFMEYVKVFKGEE